jgi:hypothetical protein
LVLHSPLLTAAGLWDEWKNRETGERLKSCTMIITEPNDFTAEIHDRMRAFLTEDQFAPWLSGEVGADYLKPASNDYLQRWPVSKRVNSSKADADDATLIEQVARMVGHERDVGVCCGDDSDKSETLRLAGNRRSSEPARWRRGVLAALRDAI